MWNKNKKMILGATSGFVLLLGLGYQNCGSDLGHQRGDSQNFKSALLEGSFPSGTYKLEFADGSKVELLKPEPVKYSVSFKDGSTAEFLARPIK